MIGPGATLRLLAALVVLAAAAPGDVARARSLPAKPPEAAMLVVPHSRSALLRAAHVLVVRVESSRTGAAAPSPGGGTEQAVELDLRLEEVLKGSLPEAAGSLVRVAAVQRGTGTGRVAAQPGVWSNQPVAPGTRFVAFAGVGAASAVEALSDPRCEMLVEGDEAAADVRLGLASERSGKDAAAALAGARAQAAAVGPFFAEWLGVRHGAALVAGAAPFDSALALLASRDLSPRGAAALVAELNRALLAQRPPPPDLLARFARALFALAAEPRTAVLREALVGSYLRSILGLDGTVAPVAPDQVFGADAAARAAARKVAEAVRDGGSLNAGDGASVVRWLGP